MLRDSAAARDFLTILHQSGRGHIDVRHISPDGGSLTP
jgi:hypothetical protein